MHLYLPGSTSKFFQRDFQKDRLRKTAFPGVTLKLPRRGFAGTANAIPRSTTFRRRVLVGMTSQYDKDCQHTCEQAQRGGPQSTCPSASTAHWQSPCGVPYFFGLLEDRFSFLFLSNVKKVWIQLLVLMVYLEKCTTIGIHQVFCIYLKTSNKTRVSQWEI